MHSRVERNVVRLKESNVHDEICSLRFIIQSSLIADLFFLPLEFLVGANFPVKQSNAEKSKSMLFGYVQKAFQDAMTNTKGTEEKKIAKSIDPFLSFRSLFASLQLFCKIKNEKTHSICFMPDGNSGIHNIIQHVLHAWNENYSYCFLFSCFVFRIAQIFSWRVFAVYIRISTFSQAFFINIMNIVEVFLFFFVIFFDRPLPLVW